jgi:hypothetical protein
VKSPFQHVLTVAVHLMVCALLACAALFLHGVSAFDAVTLPAQQSALPTDAMATTVLVAAADDTTPTDTAESVTADMSGDLPELLLSVTLPMDATARLDQQVQHPLRTLPHPFPERPQRPPRLTTRHA